MRALVVILSLFIAPVSSADPMMLDSQSLFGFSIGHYVDSQMKYEQRYLTTLSVLREHFNLSETARVVVDFGYAEKDTRTYLVEVKFCLRGNPRVCLDEQLARSFSSSSHRSLKQDFYFISLTPETLQVMAKLAARDELVMVTSAAVVTSPWFWPNQVLGVNIENFNDLIRKAGHETILPTKDYVQVKMRFEPNREL